VAVRVHRTTLVRRLHQAFARRIRKAMAVQVHRLHLVLEAPRLQPLQHPPLASELPVRRQRLLHRHHSQHFSLGRLQRQLLPPLNSLDRPTRRLILLAVHRMLEVVAAFRSLRHQLLHRVDKLPALGRLQRPRVALDQLLRHRLAPPLPPQVQDIPPMVRRRMLRHSPLVVVVSGVLQPRLQHPSVTLGKHREEVLVDHRSSNNSNSNKDSGGHR
jgi:hypothetical protein